VLTLLKVRASVAVELGSPAASDQTAAADIILVTFTVVFD